MQRGIPRPGCIGGIAGAFHSQQSRGRSGSDRRFVSAGRARDALTASTSFPAGNAGAPRETEKNVEEGPPLSRSCSRGTFESSALLDFSFPFSARPFFAAPVSPAYPEDFHIPGHRATKRETHSSVAALRMIRVEDERGRRTLIAGKLERIN